MKHIGNLFLSALTLLWPLFAMADRYVIQDDTGGGGEGVIPVLCGIALGVGIGYAYSLYDNSNNEQGLPADSCMIVGGFLGMFIFPIIFFVFK